MMKNILITGASGFLGGYVLEKLISIPDYRISLLSRSQAKPIQNLTNMDVAHYGIDDLQAGEVPFDDFDIVLHCAFARSSIGKELRSSIEFSSEIFLRGLKADCCLVNISSRSVYGQNPNVPWREDTYPEPNDMYALAKYCSEHMLDLLSSSMPCCAATHLRLAGLLGNELTDRIVNKLIKFIIDTGYISISAGYQQFAYLDVRDAADAILALLELDPQNWKRVYNLGYTRSYGIIEIAEIVANVAVEMGFPKPQIEIRESDEKLFAEMDSSLFYGDTGWRPMYDMYDTVRSIFMYQLAGENSG